MSRQNKVNPGMYTQRGRLAQDDAAREIAKQRSVGSEHTIVPVQRDAEPRLTPGSEGGDQDAATASPGETVERKPRKAPKALDKTAKAPARIRARAKKTAAPAVRAKAKRGRTPKAKAKSAQRRKS